MKSQNSNALTPLCVNFSNLQTTQQLAQYLEVLKKELIEFNENIENLIHLRDVATGGLSREFKDVLVVMRGKIEAVQVVLDAKLKKNDDLNERIDILKKGQALGVKQAEENEANEPVGDGIVFQIVGVLLIAMMIGMVAYRLYFP